MGSHEWADQTARSIPGPAPGRLRVLIGRSAAIVLILGALTWISVSLLFSPAPQAPDAGQDIPLQVLESAEGPHGIEGTVAEQPGPTQDPSTSPASGDGTAEGNATGAPPGSGATTVVHMIGAVKDPGVYSLPLGSRVLDAVNRAGGLAKDAAPEAINLAAEIKDGEQIRIPRRGEPATATASTSQGPGDAGDATETGEGAGNGGGQPKVNVNTASTAVLQGLPGIGPALSARIVEFREANGPFRNLDELDAVSGIGPAMLAKLKDLVAFE